MIAAYDFSSFLDQQVLAVPQQDTDRGQACQEEDRKMPVLGCLPPLVLAVIESVLKCHLGKAAA